MYRRIAVPTSLAVAGATLLGGGAAAEAAPGDNISCVFQGLAGNLTPGIQDITEDLNDPPFDVETGSYNFNGSASCAGRVGAQFILPTDNVTITSNGLYDNIYCGTGFAHDLSGAGTVVKDNTNGATITNFGYEIAFIAGNGRLIIGGGTPSSAGLITALMPHDTKYPAHGHGNANGNWVGNGGVQITPGNPPNGDTDNCLVDNNDGDNLPKPPATTANDGTTNTFQVAGSFSAVGK